MNKKASKILKDNLVYMILLLIFLVGMVVFVSSQMNGARVWSDYYAKETVKIINLAKPGDDITLDIHKATEIAIKNGVPTFSEIITFDNPNNEVCYKLSKGRKTCYYFFNEVDVLNPEIKIGVPINLLEFEVAEVQR